MGPAAFCIAPGGLFLPLMPGKQRMETRREKKVEKKTKREIENKTTGDKMTMLDLPMLSSEL